MGNQANVQRELRGLKHSEIQSPVGSIGNIQGAEVSTELQLSYQCKPITSPPPSLHHEYVQLFHACVYAAMASVGAQPAAGSRKGGSWQDGRVSMPGAFLEILPQKALCFKYAGMSRSKIAMGFVCKVQKLECL